MLRCSIKTCLFWLIVGSLLTSCNQAPSVPHFDHRIDRLELVNLIEGEEAIEQIDKLHGKSLNVIKGYIAHYQGNHEKATLWVSEAESEGAAQEQVDVMLQKMKDNPRSPFSNYRTLNGPGLPVIAFDGLGQVHYVFRDGPWVYWIGAHAKRIDKVLEHFKRGR